MAMEARALLDSLMGGDRNAPIPVGAALPPSKKKKRNKYQNGGSRHNSQHGNNASSLKSMRLPGVRKRSCYDPKICPLYCAWGVDVFELFINTKSDIGANLYLVDTDAYDEFQSLPPIDKERLGFEYMLYKKLQELVRSCDRTVSRNKEKLRNEISRAMKNLPADPIEIVDLDGVKRTSELMLAFEEGTKELEVLVKALDNTGETHITNCINTDALPKDLACTEANVKLLQELHPATSQVVQKMLELQPLKEQIDTSKRSLYFYRSDTSTDKTVCEVSGNFMSSRDADERIAAHFAGKQYVGWKLVREKYKDLDKKFRNYRGPPPPPQRMGHPHPSHHHTGGNGNGPPPMMQRRRERSRSRERDSMSRNRQPSPPRRYGGGGGGGGGHGPPPDYYRGGGGGYGHRHDDRGGGRYNRRR